MLKHLRSGIFFWCVLALLLARSGVGARAAESTGDLRLFLSLLARDPAAQDRAFAEVEQRWDPAWIAPLLDVAGLSNDERIFPLLRRRTGEKRREDLQIGRASCRERV